MLGGSPSRRRRKRRRWKRRIVKLAPMKDFFHLWSPVLGINWNLFSLLFSPDPAAEQEGVGGRDGS